MKHALLATALSVLFTVGCLHAQPASASPAPPRIGTFDSRAVAFAWARSDEGMRTLRGLHEEYARAKAANDEKRVKELEQEGPWTQVRLHQQVFSTATVATLMQKVADRLPAIARQAGVALIVSKWEMPYRDGSVETVDLTLDIARLFTTDEQVLTGISQLTAQPPIPFEKLPLDPRM